MIRCYIKCIFVLTIGCITFTCYVLLGFVKHKTCVIGFLTTRRYLLHPIKNDNSYVRRSFWRIVDDICNRFDQARVEEVGCNQACAEWLVMCGAQVKWKNTNIWHSDYNKLPGASAFKYIIEEVNADNAVIMKEGFSYFEGVQTIKKMRIHKCPYIDTSAIQQLSYELGSLEHFELSSCDVNDQGICSLSKLRNLRTLALYDLPEVKDKQGCENIIQKAVPNCQIKIK